MDIQVTAGSTLASPAAGYVTIFINTEDSNKLSYKYPDGTVVAVADANSECCACVIAENQMEAVACALRNGSISATEYQAIITLGLNVSVTETDDGAGNKTCTVNVKPTT